MHKNVTRQLFPFFKQQPCVTLFSNPSHSIFLLENNADPIKQCFQWNNQSLTGHYHWRIIQRERPWEMIAIISPFQNKIEIEYCVHQLERRIATPLEDVQQLIRQYIQTHPQQSFYFLNQEFYDAVANDNNSNVYLLSVPKNIAFEYLKPFKK